MKKNSKKKLNTGEDYILTPKSPFTVREAYKSLRTNLMFSLTEPGCKTIVVTSSEQGEAKSTTAVNLALTFAENGAKTLLLDCDLRLPTDSLKLHVKAGEGLTDALVGQTKLSAVVHHLKNGLDFIPSGTVPPNPTELLGSERMKKALEVLSKYYEYIIIDTPPVGTVADAVILSGFVSGVTVVARQNSVTKDSLKDTIDRLNFAGAHILGIIETGVITKNKHYGSYKKGYGYGYER